MALTIETGASNPNADSFATVAEARAFATARGVTLPVADNDVETALRKAADFLRSLDFQGRKTSRLQGLPFPRIGMLVEEEEIPQTEIPVEVKNAQIQLAMEAQTEDLLPTGSGREVVREKVDVIETEYAATGGGSLQPVFTKALAWLEPFLTGADGLAGINATIYRA